MRFHGGILFSVDHAEKKRKKKHDPMSFISVLACCVSMVMHSCVQAYFKPHMFSSSTIMMQKNSRSCKLSQTLLYLKLRSFLITGSEADCLYFKSQALKKKEKRERREQEVSGWPE